MIWLLTQCFKLISFLHISLYVRVTLIVVALKIRCRQDKRYRAVFIISWSWSFFFTYHLVGNITCWQLDILLAHTTDYHGQKQHKDPAWARGPLFPLFPPCPFTSSSFALFLLFPFSFSHSLYLFSSSVHPFPLFCQSSPTPFPGRRSSEVTEHGFSLSCSFCVICIP